MAVSEEKTNELLHQLSGLGGEIKAKSMFGGIGLSRDDTMFAMIDSKETFRMRVDNSSQMEYETA